MVCRAWALALLVGFVAGCGAGAPRADSPPALARAIEGAAVDRPEAPAPRTAPRLPDRPTLAELLAAAQERNAGIREAAAAVEIARLDRADARLAAMPAVEAHAGYIGSSVQPSGNVPDFISVNGREEYITTLGVRVPVFRGGEYFAGVRASESALEGARSDENARRLDLSLRVREAYYEVVRSEAQQDDLRGLEARLAELLRYIALARREGLAAEIDTNRSTLVQAMVRNREAAAAAARGSALAGLASLLGVDRIEGVAPPSPLGAAPLPLGETATAALVGEAFARSPDVGAARAAVAKAEAEIDKASAGHWPGVDATADWGFDSDELPNRDNFGWSAGVSITVPLFSWGRVSREVERAEKRLARERARADLLEEELRRGVRAAAIARDLAAENLGRGLEALAASRRIVEQSRLGFEDGALTNLELLDAWQSHTSAEMDVENARFELRAAEARLARLLGREE